MMSIKITLFFSNNNHMSQSSAQRKHNSQKKQLNLEMILKTRLDEIKDLQKEASWLLSIKCLALLRAEQTYILQVSDIQVQPKMDPEDKYFLPGYSKISVDHIAQKTASKNEIVTIFHHSSTKAEKLSTADLYFQCAKSAFGKGER
jgi:hypothetical protein